MDSADTTARVSGPDGADHLEAIMDEHKAGLLRYATRILNDPNAAQDVVQNTFLKMIEGWQKGAKPGPKMKGWLYRVAHNNAVDYIRKESRLRVLHDEHAKGASTAYPAKQHQHMERKEAMKVALDLLGSLKPSAQQVVILRLEEGMSYKQIAEITKRTEGNVGCILHNAMKKVAEGLKASGAI